MSGFPWLTVTIFLPLAGIPVLYLWPRISPRTTHVVAFGVSLATFGFALGTLANFDAGASGFQLVDRATWVEGLHLQYLVGVDGISLFLVVITTFLVPVAILASFREQANPRMLMATILALECFVLGTFTALDLLLFFLFFKLGTFDFRVLVQHADTLPAATARWLFLGFLVAFAVKAPLVPFHSWQPDAYTEAPTGGLLILAGLLPKIAPYGLIRFNLALFPEASRYFSHLVAILALIGIVYGAVVAIMQTDLKRLVAYSSISHVGLIVLGIFAFTEQGVSGSVLYMVNHALSTGVLFLLVGMLYERTRTRDVVRMGGIAQVTPRFAAVFLVVGLASMGLPGLNNFVSEFLV